MTTSTIKTIPCKYKTSRTLGQGSYAVVKEAIEIETGKHYAAKVLNKALLRGREHLIRNEIDILKKLSLGHPNILSLVDCFETPNNLYIITDLASGGELFDRIYKQGSFFEKDAARLVFTIVEALKYLHDNGIVHRDLKPENLLFLTPAEDSPLLIADFGLSKVIGPQTGDVLNTTCGTPNYMAPETFNKGGYGKPVDMWAIGVITFLLLSGHPPFNISEDFLDFSPIINANYSFIPKASWAGISDNAKDFIKLLLVRDPSERLNAVEALEHPWLAEFNAGSRSKHPGEATDLAPTNLLPGIRENFNARKTFRKIVGLVRVINKVCQAGQNPSYLPMDEDISKLQVIP